MDSPDEISGNRQTMCRFSTMAPDPLDTEGPFSIEVDCEYFEMRLTKEEIANIRTSIYLDSCDDDSDDEGSDRDESLTSSTPIASDERHSTLSKRLRWLEDMDEDDRLSLSSTPEMRHGANAGRRMQELAAREQKRAKTAAISIAGACACPMEQSALCF